MTFFIKQNDTNPALRATLLNGSNNPVDVQNASVRFMMRKIGETNADVDAAATLINPAAGLVQYNWVAGDTSDIGSYQAEFEVTYSTGLIETFPNNGYIRVEIRDDIA